MRKKRSRWVFNYAHVKVDEKLPRGFWWALLISWHSMLSSLQWNGEISKEIFTTIFIWLRDGIIKLRK